MSELEVDKGERWMSKCREGEGVWGASWARIEPGRGIGRDAVKIEPTG